MHATAIRHLAVCQQNCLLAAAFFESTVQIWNWKEARQIGEFETILDFGGERLLLAHDGSVCIAGSWTRGLAAYSVPDGACVWERPELMHVQLLTWSTSGQEVNCGFEEGPLAVIDIKTGITLKRVRGAKRVFCSPYNSWELIEERKRYRIVGAHSFEISPISHCLLDAAFSPEAVCITEGRAGIRCVELESGKELWHHPRFWSNHVGFSASDNNFYCAAMKDAAPHECSLVRLAPNLLDCDQVASVGLCWEAAFSDSGKFSLPAEAMCTKRRRAD